jgi:hypothetical protein
LADTVYWANWADQTIQGAPLAGGGNVDTLYGLTQGVLGPLGVALYPAAGRIYWTNYGGSWIRGAPLAGGIVDDLYGPLMGIPDQLAIDPAAGRIYWANEIDDTICAAPLAGGGIVDVLYQGPSRGVSGPGGVAIDPGAGRIYWSNGGDNTIRGARLAGGGAVDLLYGPADGVSRPFGVALDGAAGQIYWANGGDNTIRGARLAGGGIVDTFYGPAHGVRDPIAVAVDPTAADRLTPIVDGPRRSGLSRLAVAVQRIVNQFRDLLLGRFTVGRIYWANSGDNTIRGAPLAVAGPVDILYSGPGRGVNGPRFLAVLRAPAGAGAPAISGGGGLGQPLACSRGMWAADLLGSSLYRAPQSFSYQWTQAGSDVGGATLATYTPGAPGSYACRVTAVNPAGRTAQTSAPVAVS